MKCYLLIVISLSLWNAFLTQDYVIQRRHLSGKGDYKADTFKIPSEKCIGDGSEQCAAKNGTKANTQCKCVCDKKEFFLYKSTFMYYDNSWKCANNADVRNNGGCSILFNFESHDSPITTIISGEGYNLKNLDSSCDITSGGYARCSGNWKVLNQQSLSNFSLLRNYWGWPTRYIVVKHYDPDEASLSGRIVRLNISCSSQQQQKSDCIIFKIEGKLNCPYLFSSSSTLIQPTTSISSLPLTQLMTSTSSTPKLPSTSMHMQQMSSQSLPSKSATSTILPTSSTVPFSLSRTPGFPTKSQIPVSSGKSTEKRSTKTRTTDQSLTTSKTVENYKKSASKGTDNSDMIAGALAGVIGLAIIVIAIIAVMRKRKKRTAASPPKNTNTAENAGYGRGEDHSLRFIDTGQQSPDEDEYSYAYNNAVQFMRANKKALESHTSNDGEPGTASVANHMYGRTEELNQVGPVSHNEAPVYNTLEEAVYAKVDKSKKENPPSSDAPIYNTLEEPEYAKVDKTRKTKLSENHNEPLYNVLEGPETDEGLSEEPPCYQVLEGPFLESAPVYDVLEGPESDETPVYGALDGQDPHVYGALDRVPAIQGSSTENRGYDDMVYDSVGDVINEQGDIYQELNQSGQRDSDVYQALNYPNKTMQLNELNQTHSNA